MRHNPASVTITVASGLLALALAAPAGVSDAVSGPHAAILVAGAPDGVLTPAPIPSLPPSGPSPADRAAQPGSSLAAGPVGSTPFSAAPDTLLSGGGTEGPQSDRLRTSGDTSADTVPNLGK